ncbi:MAG TPA: TRC40/GET3/ArsA family transport-energizing ATPase [Sulfolobales archaeon]|nr:TRC40/GET3/ArsA family transport-energizing ATPase [Sulfolobales archaeon]
MPRSVGFKYLFEKRPELKIAIFAGKGGLGKTTSSAALSYKLSTMGKRVLCFSTDPQASLSDIFEKDLFGKGEIELSKNLYVLEIDADKRIKEYVDSIRQKIRDMYKIEEIPREVEDYIESAVAEPAMYESAVYDAMLDVVSQNKYDFYVFDMPPFGHGIRMVAMADILSKWVDKITEARRQAYEYEKVASRLKREKYTEREDQLLKELESIRDRIVSFSKLITDPKGTAFTMVLIPEKMAIVDTEKALKMFEELGLKMSGVVVNQVYPPVILEDPRAPEYLKKRVEAQRPFLREIYEKFEDLIVAIIPMFRREPRGLEMIEAVAKELWESTITLDDLEAISGR